MQLKAIVLGAGGFIGSHLVRRLKSEGYWVRGVDLKFPEHSITEADDFIIGDLRDISVVNYVIIPEVDELYQLAADMGGAGYIFTGEHDADVMHNSAQINLNVARVSVEKRVKSLFYSSSACVYPEHNQLDPLNPKCAEDTVYPAAPDSEYGWEKLFSERLYMSYKRNYGLNVKIARYHNIYGPEGAWNNGKEKAPAALCRKVANASPDGHIEIWGDGKQTRSFLFIDDCLDATTALVRSDLTGPYNIGSEEMIAINDFARLIMNVAKKEITIDNIDGPEGVRGRCSDNRAITNALGWRPNYDLRQGITITYDWVHQQLANVNKVG
jgi:GDP-D-mannose 3',5'-epimerase